MKLTGQITDDSGEILKGWHSLAEDYVPDKLTENEVLIFEQYRFAEDQSRKSNFMVGV